MILFPVHVATIAAYLWTCRKRGRKASAARLFYIMLLESFILVPVEIILLK